MGLLTGKAGTSGDSLTIGGVTFTVQDGIYSPETGQLFASAVISADESVQLVAVEADMEHEVRLTTPGRSRTARRSCLLAWKLRQPCNS